MFSISRVHKSFVLLLVCDRIILRFNFSYALCILFRLKKFERRFWGSCSFVREFSCPHIFSLFSASIPAPKLYTFSTFSFHCPILSVASFLFHSLKLFSTSFLLCFPFTFPSIYTHLFNVLLLFCFSYLLFILFLSYLLFFFCSLLLFLSSSSLIFFLSCSYLLFLSCSLLLLLLFFFFSYLLIFFSLLFFFVFADNAVTLCARMFLCFILNANI
jgi:hypothetical protein